MSNMKIYLLILMIFLIISFSCYHMNNPFAPTNIINEQNATNIITQPKENGNLRVSLSGAVAKNGKDFHFFVYDHPVADNTKDYIAKGSFVISSGSGSALARDRSTDQIMIFQPTETLYVFTYVDDGGTKIELENAQDISQLNTTGTFGGGMVLKSYYGINLVEGSGNDYENDSSLSGGTYDIFDTSDSGDYFAKRCIRLVHNNDNITNILGLIPLAKDLTNILAPNGSYNSGYKLHTYIDPATGKFVLPRPVIWSKLEDASDWTTPEIKDEDLTPTTSTGGTSTVIDYPVGIFGNCLHFTGDFDNGDNFQLWAGGTKNWDQGTYEAWAKVHILAFTDIRILMINIADFGVQLTSHVTNGTSASLFIDGFKKKYEGLSDNTWYHFYVIWDKNKDLSGDSSVRVFLNGAPILDSSSDLPNMNFNLRTTASPAWENGESWIDNIKAWNHVVSEDTAFINALYNSGAGDYEDALHEIYGSGNNYKPNSNIDVGYFTGPGRTLWPDTGEMNDEKTNISIDSDTTVNFSYGDFTAY